ncbi:MAG: phosphoribosylformylglycinamidine synthase subunit PurL, partial [Bacteroidota bacterium]
FEDCYHTNPLVNAMSVGIVKAGKTVSAIALGKGNPVFFVGSATGKDGIGGASFASAEITADSVEELPAVQVGDPFQEKKLLEACLEVIETGGVVGMQDMGAAGIICSTAEMSAKGQVGMRIDLDKVPTRQQNMKAWELLLSESQERMLMVVEKGREADVLAVFEKWDLSCSNIGEVTDDGLLNFYMHGELEASLPAYELVLGGGAPQYTREYKEPAYLAKVNAFDMNTIADTDNLKASVEALIQLPNIASKRWVYTQYDSMVGAANTSTNAPSDAAVVLAKGTGKALAMTVDCNSKYVFADPYKGAMIAVSEAARNIVCSGGEPIGVTNCLNFGNPYDPEVYYQFVKSVEGMGAACRKFNTPVTGGNVSFYNQNPDGPVFPTPTIGMVGIVEDIKNRMTLDFKTEGDSIILLGTQRNDIGSSEYLNKLKGVAHSSAPHFELEEEFALQQLVAQLIKDHTIESAHDISEGGLIVTLLESAYFNNKGFEVSSNNSDLRKDAYWMGEAQSRVVVSCIAASVASIEAAAAKAGIATFVMGKVTGGAVKVEGEDWGNISTWKNKYDTAIENKLK